MLSIDFMIGSGSRTPRLLPPYYKDKQKLKEGSIDYFSLLAFQKDSNEFLRCFETMARQVVSRFNYESINFQSVMKSVGYYDKKSNGIVTCATNFDSQDDCNFNFQ